ncbi:MAG TPA: cupin domain-containing protein [Steroidobacteraceae bacterium]|jgi:uncharacterized cupin superfamily protein
MAKKFHRHDVPTITGSRYPAPFHEPCVARARQRLGDAGGLTQFGVNLLRLAPGAWSSQRHWHSGEDEFVYVLEGEVVLVTDSGEELVRSGDCAGFKAGEANGHHLKNSSGSDALILEIGSRRSEDEVIYPDIDLHVPKRENGFTHKNGEPYA